MYFIWRPLLSDGNLSSKIAFGLSTIVQKENVELAAWLKASPSAQNVAAKRRILLYSIFVNVLLFWIFVLFRVFMVCREKFWWQKSICVMKNIDFLDNQVYIHGLFFWFHFTEIVAEVYFFKFSLFQAKKYRVKSS